MDKVQPWPFIISNNFHKMHTCPKLKIIKKFKKCHDNRMDTSNQNILLKIVHKPNMISI